MPPGHPPLFERKNKNLFLEGIFAPVNYQRFHMYFMRGNDVSRRRAEPVKEKKKKRLRVTGVNPI